MDIYHCVKKQEASHWQCPVSQWRKMCARSFINTSYTSSDVSFIISSTFLQTKSIIGNPLIKVLPIFIDISISLRAWLPQCTQSLDLAWELWLGLGRVCSCARLGADSFNSSHSAGQCHSTPSATQREPVLQKRVIQIQEKSNYACVQLMQDQCREEAIILYCGFSSNWILHYFPLSVRVFVRVSQAWHLTFLT